MDKFSTGYPDRSTKIYADMLNSFKSNIHQIYSVRLLIRDAFITSMIFSILALYIHEKISILGLTLTAGIGIGYALGFAVNDYFDRDLDKNDISKVNKNYFVKNSQVLGLFVLFSLLLVVFFLFSIFGLVLSIFAFWSYSAKPFRFKNRPGLDLFTHGIFIETYPYVITLFLLKIDWMVIDYFVLAILFFNSIINQIGQQLRDFHIDSLTEKNFTIKYGQDRAIAVNRGLNIIIIILSILGLIFGELKMRLIPLIIVVLPLYVLRLSSKYYQNKPHKLYKTTILLVTLYWVGIITLQFLF
ncbi:MAG: UbiA family prenyltransferase [Candidatus Kariarchaeaceae archaeon]